jgi:hypothetical protein
MKSLQDWIRIYNKKAEPFKLEPGFLIDFLPDKGFMCWRVVGPIYEIDHLCTNDVKFFIGRMTAQAKELGCVKLRTQTLHDPAAFMRMTKAMPRFDLSGIRSNGKMYWVFEMEVV